MLRRTAIVALLILAITASSVAFCEEDKWISASLKLEYISQYQWRGWDVSVGDPALWPELSFGFGETDFYAGVWMNFNTSNRYSDNNEWFQWKDWDEIDFFFGHWWGLFEDKWYNLEIETGFTYFYFPQQPRDADTMQLDAGFKMPNLLKFAGTNFGPYTTVYYGWSARNTDYENEDGLYFQKGADPGVWVKLGLNWHIPIGENFGLDVYTETYHNDGGQSLELTMSGDNAGTHWSHIAYGLKGAYAWKQFTFSGSLNYQETWNRELESINSSDVDSDGNWEYDDYEFWYSFAVACDF